MKVATTVRTLLVALIVFSLFGSPALADGLVGWGGCWAFDKYFNGHGVPVGRFSPMIIALERTAKDTIAFCVTLNNEEHTCVDKGKSPYAADMEKMESLYGEGSRHVVVVPGYQPRNIDTMAIYFASQRPFDLITFARLEP